MSSLVACDGCKGKDKTSARAEAGARAAGRSTKPDGGLGSRWPTTSFAIAAGNLDADIEGRTANDQGEPEFGLKLVELLLLRGQYLAKIDDYERADAIASGLVTNHPKSAASHLARAHAHASLHRFEHALHALDEAASLGAPGERVDAARASIFMTLGRYDDAAKLMPAVTDTTRPLDLATAAVLAAHMQKHDESERLFETARSRIRDVSPFPLAWMDYQRATLLDARGRETQARAYYEEACDVIPLYVHAVVHLVATDPLADAVARLEALRKELGATQPDPDLLAALALAHQKVGHHDEAKRLTDEARARYEALLVKHPEAFWDHAARFWLGPGNDPMRAVDLAEKNAQLRPTEEALDLFMAAAAAAARPQKVCASARAMDELRWVSPERKRLASAALAECADAGP